MKRLLIALALAGATVSAQVHAADLARKAPILKAPAAVVYSWTGFYLGVNAGGSVGKDRTQFFTRNDVGTSPQVNLSPFGVIGGGQLGYNWQINSDWLLGIESDIQGSGERDGYTCLLDCRPNNSINFNQRIGWFGTTRARVGLVDGPVLSYLTAGVAYGQVNTSFVETTGLVGTVPFSASATKVGYAYGSGVEASLGGAWTGKIEYLYIDLGKQSYAIAAPPLAQALSTRIHDNIFRVGLNYRIGANGAYMPVAAYSWTGFYLGGNLGSVLGRDNTTMTTIATGVTSIFHFVPDGFQGGGQIGYNWQASSWVFGLEADFQGSTARDKDVCIFGCNPTFAINMKQTLPWFGTARGRIGYALGSTLFYGTAGAAYGQTRTDFSSYLVPLGLFGTNTVTHNRAGWTAGGGIESPLKLFGLFGPNWTARTEYLYVDLGRTSDVITNAGFGAQTFSTRTQEHVFRGGINYHFN
jgi:outer membrane immunogenic protein